MLERQVVAEQGDVAKRGDAAERWDVAEHEEAERLCLLVYAGTASHQYLCVWTPAINCGTHNDIFEERKCYVHGSPKQIAFFAHRPYLKGCMVRNLYQTYMQFVWNYWYGCKLSKKI